MELSLIEVQQSMYGENGPPMFPHSASKAASRRHAKRRKLRPAPEPFKLPPVKPVNELKGAESLVACQLPDGFPPELAFRALAAYALLRTLSRELRLSPFTPNVFLRALTLPYPSRLLGQVHVNLLRILLPRLNLGYGYRAHGGSIGVFKKRRLDGIRWPLLGGDNLTYLDNYTWPLFYDDYCHLTADVLWVSMNDTNLYIDIRIGDLAEASDDENEKVEDTVEISPKAALEVSQTRNKQADRREPLAVAETIQDSDDEYNGEEEEEDGGELDDEFERSKFSSKKRKRGGSKQAPTRKKFRSTRSSPHRLSPPTPTSSSNSSRYDSQDLMPISILRATKGIRKESPTAYANPHNFSNASFAVSLSMPNAGHLSTIVADDTSVAAPVEDALVSEVEVISGSPLSQATIFGAAQVGASALSQSAIFGAAQVVAEVRPHVGTASAVGRMSSQGVDGVKHHYEVPFQQLMFRNHGNRHLASQFVTSKVMPSAPSVSGLVSGSSGLNLSPQRIYPSRPQGKPVPPQSAVATNKRPFSRFALPLNRARNHAVPSSQASFATNLNAHAQDSVAAGVPYSNFSVRWDQSETASMLQHESSYPSRVMMLEEAPLRVASLPVQSQTKYDDQRVASLPTVVESKKYSIDVCAEIADELENAFMESGHSSADDEVENSATLHSGSKQSDDVIDTPVSEPTQGKDLTGWSQFKAIKRMRNGVPYHCLPTDEKLDMLEFLVDELLAIDFIAAEFTKRDAVNGSHPFPYGCLPSQSELELLENEDECGICGREGDLLCCDECTSSYHTLCLGMAQSTRIPEGKWVCPECRLADPCKFGSLRGGKKGSIDWFTMQDLIAAGNIKHQTDGQINDSVLGAAYPFQDRSTFQGKLKAVPGNELAAIPHRQTFAVSEGVEDTEFLVVGSFVFTRSRGPDELPNWRTARSESFRPLGQENLARWLLKLGPDIGTKWPFAQIPQNPREIWNGLALFSSYTSSALYFATLDSHDPSFYWSQYRKAPLPKSMKAGAGAQSATLSELENEFIAIDTNRLSGVLSRDLQFDGIISRELKNSTRLFDPYHVISSFMIRLEGSLRKAGLLDESWGTRNAAFKTDMWVQNVRRCQSIRRLAILLVKLVDATHPRCFVDEWHKVPGSTKSAENSNCNTATSLSARRFNLPNDWSPEAELLRRKWESCPIWAMRALMAKPSQNGSRCIMSPVQPSGRKRKHGAVPVKMKSDVAVTCPTDVYQDVHLSDQQPPVNCKQSLTPADGQSNDTVEPVLDVQPPRFPSGEFDINLDAGLPEEVANERPSRRRPARTTRSGAFISTESNGAYETEEMSMSEMELLVESEQNKKLTELEKLSRAPSLREGHWPLAGRKLFEPAGYLPPLEMRRLARKAGAAAAPFVTYSASHEVGQTSLSHRWRKRTLESKSYEEILLQIKSLESFIETSAIVAGDTLVRRLTSSKKQLALNITVGCSHSDLPTGVSEYFVLDKDRRRGCWVSLANMELSPLILGLYDRSEAQFKKMEKRKELFMEKRNKAILASSIRSSDLALPSEKYSDSNSRQVGRHNNEPACDERHRPQKARKREASDRVGSTSSLEVQIQTWNQEVEASLLQHQLETGQLMIDRTKQGLSLLPPESQMHELRLQRTRALKTPLEGLRRYGESSALEAEIVARLTQSEINALTMMEGAKLAKGSAVAPVSPWPSNLTSATSQAPILSTNYPSGAEAMNGASSGSIMNGRSMMDPLPSTAPTAVNSLSYLSAVDFDPSGRTNSASRGFATPMLPYFQSNPPTLPPSSLPFHQNGTTTYQNVPMNVARDTWSQNNVVAQSQTASHSLYGPGSNPQYINSNVPQGMYSQLQNNSFVNNYPYSQPAFQASPADPYFSQQQQHNLNSVLQPNFQTFHSMRSMPASNDQNFRVNLDNVSRPVQQQQTFASQASAPPGEFPMGFDFEPRPIEEMSHNNAQDLESLLRRFTRYPR